MRGPRVWITTGLVCATQLVACSGTRGTLVVSRQSADAGAPIDAGATRADAQVAGPLWQPAAGATFQLQLTGELDTSVDAEVYIIDLDSPAEDFAGLRAAGRRTVCHFSAGTVETFRDDAEAIPDSARGQTLADYPNERWLDITAPGVREVMAARLARAVERGCSAVLPANLTVHLQDSGFALSAASSIAYARWLATAAAALGLSAMLSSEELVDALAPDYQMGLAFECLAADACQRWAPLRTAGKPLMVVEVGDADSAPTLCATARDAGLNAIIKSPSFDAFRIACP